MIHNHVQRVVFIILATGVIVGVQRLLCLGYPILAGHPGPQESPASQTEAQLLLIWVNWDSALVSGSQLLPEEVSGRLIKQHHGLEVMLYSNQHVLGG